MSVDDLRSRQRTSETSLLTRYADRLLYVERLRPWLVILGLIGGMVAAFARLAPGTFGVALTIGGGLLAVVAGGLAALVDYRKIELGQEARNAHAIADEALGRAEDVARVLSEVRHAAETMDQQRRERLLAIEQMVEAVEAGLLRRADAAATANAMLRRSIAAIRKSVDYQSADFFTVTIFRREDGADGAIMRRVAAQWTDPEKAEAGGREWRLGKGYTGVAWHNAMTNRRGDVVEEDTTRVHCRDQYPVEHYDADREIIYRSVAAIPILIGESNDVWGVVTATSSRAGVFNRAATASQNVAVIRDIARVAALLAGLPQGDGRQSDENRL